MRILNAGLLASLFLLAGCTSLVVVEPTPEPERPSTAASLGIPPGHLPPPGECRVWFPGRPPGHQPPPGPCHRLEAEAPLGAWLIYRPSKDRKQVRVSVYHETRPQFVVEIRLYDAATGQRLN